jgi:tripartite-type tricarboxylate transporter receptor subunit TctC
MLATYPHVKGGKLRILAVSSAARLPSIPDVPTVAESGFPGFETGSWQGILAPPGTPREIVARLGSEVQKVLATSEVKERLAGQGAEVRVTTPAELGAFIAREKDRWGTVVKEAGIKAE